MSLITNNGRIRDLFTWKDDILDGPYQCYFENGQLEEKGSYKDGRRHGLMEGYFKDGGLIHKGGLNMGKQCGDWTVTNMAGPPEIRKFGPC